MEQELSLEQQVLLAQTLSEAVDARNNFTAGFGGFDDFADVHQHVGDNRAQYDALDKAASDARKELDEKVSDKKALVEHLRSIGENELAAKIGRMFQVK